VAALDTGSRRENGELTVGASEGVPMAGFVQIVEWKTSRLDEIQKFMDDWRDQHPEMGPSRVLAGADRDNAGRYMSVVEFDSYEAAMENSAHPTTSEFAERMQEFCDGPPTFHNLDVVRDDHRS
jgi:hypothetical protein